MVTNGITYGASQLTSESVSYKKQDGELTTVKQALDELIGKSSKVDDLEKQVTDYQKVVYYLADVAKEGDYVAYDAGTWDETVELPTKQGEFGGYSKGQSKNTSVSVCTSGGGSTSMKGWRVLTVDKDSKVVTIVHAGIPECYYHEAGHAIESADNKLKEHANPEYLNKKYATEAHIMTKTEALNIVNNYDITENDLRTVGAMYWLGLHAADANGLFFVQNTGSISNSTNYSWALGFRPVVVLKTGILTTGKGIDEFKQEAWTLVAPAK